MAEQVKGGLTTSFDKYGLSLDEFNIGTVSLPEELQKALDERIGAGMKGGMSQSKMDGFTRFNTAEAIPLAAQNEGGLAGMGATMGAGLAMGQAMAQGLGVAAGQQQAAQPAQAAAPAAEAPEAQLEKLKGMFDKGLISQTDYDAAKAKVLQKMIG
jgi:membrane protease subunit (stomatin/prohibitin family)